MLSGVVKPASPERVRRLLLEEPNSVLIALIDNAPLLGKAIDYLFKFINLLLLLFDSLNQYCGEVTVGY